MSILVVDASVAIKWFVPEVYTPAALTAIGGRSFNRGENGLWLRYLRYFGKQSEAETQAMVQRKRRDGVWEKNSST
ncbi:MAG TPA: hypothetical protein V6D08_19280 [Candidatus Obscuribacterales bacterium]